MTGLNVIFRNLSHVMVLRVLYDTDEPLTGREVERRSGLSNRATMLALEALILMRVVNMDTVGRAHLHTLNHEHYLTAKAVKPAFDAEHLFWADFAKTVQRSVRPRAIAAVATGPLVRDETEYGGRITLTILFSSGRDRVKSLRSIQRLASRIKDRHALAMEYRLLDLNTMNKEQYAPLWRRVEREGILLFGTLP